MSGSLWTALGVWDSIDFAVSKRDIVHHYLTLAANAAVVAVRMPWFPGSALMVTGFALILYTGWSEGRRPALTIPPDLLDSLDKVLADALALSSEIFAYAEPGSQDRARHTASRLETISAQIESYIEVDGRELLKNAINSMRRIWAAVVIVFHEQTGRAEIDGAVENMNDACRQFRESRRILVEYIYNLRQRTEGRRQ